MTQAKPHPRFGPCQYCGVSHRFTRDHIIPRRTGAGWFLHGSTVKNYRLVCLECNQLRAEAGDCTGLLLIVLRLASETKMHPKRVLRGLRKGARGKKYHNPFQQLRSILRRNR